MGFRGGFEGGLGCAGWDTNKQEKNTSKQGKTFPNKKKHQQTRETPTNKKKPFKQGGNTNKQEKHLSTNKKKTFQAREHLSSKGYLPIKCRGLQVVGVSGQGKVVVSDGRYGVIGGGYCLLVWGDAEGTKGKRWR